MFEFKLGLISVLLILFPDILSFWLLLRIDIFPLMFSD